MPRSMFSGGSRSCTDGCPASPSPAAQPPHPRRPGEDLPLGRGQGNAQERNRRSVWHVEGLLRVTPGTSWVPQEAVLQAASRCQHDRAGVGRLAPGTGRCPTCLARSGQRPGPGPSTQGTQERCWFTSAGKPSRCLLLCSKVMFGRHLRMGAGCLEDQPCGSGRSAVPPPTYRKGRGAGV